MNSSDRPSRNPDRRTSLTAMARAMQRTPQPLSAAVPPANLKSGVPATSASWERSQFARDELPAPYDDASGFIDLDKLREAAAAPPVVHTPPSPPPSRLSPPLLSPPVLSPPESSPGFFPLSPPPYQARTAPPVAATISVAPPPRSGVLFGMVVGGAIAAVGLAGGYFMASRSSHVRDMGGAAAKQQSMALNATPPQSDPAPVAPPADPLSIAAPPATAIAKAPAAPPIRSAHLPPASAQAPASGDTHRAIAAPSVADPSVIAAGVRDLGTIEPGDSPGAGSKERRARQKPRVAARRAKTDGFADAKAEPHPNPAFLQALQKSAEQSGSSPVAGSAATPAPGPAPTPARAPAARTANAAPRSGLAAAIQKASGVGPAEAAPAPAAPAPGAPAGAPIAGVPDAPSQGAVRAALASQLAEAKVCVQDDDAPSRANLTFGPDGRVKSITVSGPAAGTPEEECIRGVLQKTNVGPFSRPTFVVGLTLRPL